MDYYQKNIDCIKEHRDFLYNSMQKYTRESKLIQVEEIHSIKTKEVADSLVIRVNGNQYRINSSYYPTKEAKIWAEQFKIKNVSHIISMYGLGNAIFANELYKTLRNSDALVIYEPSIDVFFYVLGNYDITDLLKHDNVSITVKGINDLEFHNTLRGIMDISNMSNQIICKHPFYEEMFPDSAFLFYTELKEAYINTKTNINTEIFFGKRFLTNIFNNIQYIKGGNTIYDLKKHLPENATAIIVGAGPSVERQIDELKRAKGKAIIVAVDRALDFMLNAGIEPDFIATLDPIKPIEYFTKRKDVMIPLICFIQANHEILNHHAGRKIISNCTEYLRKIYLDADKPAPMTLSGSSVATVAFSSCKNMGIQNFILVGQDLAYDGDSSHVGGVKEESIIETSLMVENIHGDMVKSRYDWKEIILWCEDLIHLSPELNVIDAKDNGAKINGTKIMSLKEAVDAISGDRFDINEVMQQMQPTFNEEELTEIKKFFQNNHDSLYKIRKKAKEAIEASEVLLREERRNQNPTRMNEAFKKLSKISEAMAKEPVYVALDQLIKANSAQHLLELSHISDDIKTDNINTFETTIAIYQAVIEAVDFVKPKLEEAIGYFD